MLIKKIARYVWRKLFPIYWTRSYSQEGEDLILKRIFEYKNTGFYVDIGAHHPKRFSNTYLFYKRGWRGINVDATPGSMRAFKKNRPRDINLELAVSNVKQTLHYYQFNEPALNSFSKERVKSCVDQGYKLIAETAVEAHLLSEILLKYLPAGQKIDFMSIDVEGLDFAVMQSNDWMLYRPAIVLVEFLAMSNFEALFSHPGYKLLKENGYELFAKTFNTVFFKDSRVSSH